jgi:hypothetical protein
MGQPAIGLLQILLGRRASDAQNFVVISFINCHALLLMNGQQFPPFPAKPLTAFVF